MVRILQTIDFLRQKTDHCNAEKYNNKINGDLASMWKLHIADVLLRHICQIVNHIPIVADIHNAVFENNIKSLIQHCERSEQRI